MKERKTKKKEITSSIKELAIQPEKEDGFPGYFQQRCNGNRKP